MPPPVSLTSLVHFKHNDQMLLITDWIIVDYDLSTLKPLYSVKESLSALYSTNLLTPHLRKIQSPIFILLVQLRLQTINCFKIPSIFVDSQMFNVKRWSISELGSLNKTVINVYPLVSIPFSVLNFTKQKYHLWLSSGQVVITLRRSVRCLFKSVYLFNQLLQWGIFIPCHPEDRIKESFVHWNNVVKWVLCCNGWRVNKLHFFLLTTSLKLISVSSLVREDIFSFQV